MSKAILLKQNGESMYPCPYYPVGSIYISVNNTNPATYFGGTWEQIKSDAYLKIVSSNAGKLGGTSSSHKIPVASLPAHSHSAWLNNAGGHNHVFWFGGGANSGTGAQIPVANSRWGQDTAGQTDGGHDHGGISVANTGSGQAYYPYYLGVYVWKRTR